MFYVAEVGANCTFFYQGVQKATPTDHLVTVDIPEGLLVLWLLIPSSSFLLVLFSFCIQYLHDDGALLLLYPEDAKWTKDLSSYFFNYNFNFSHEPWICKTPLCLDTNRNPNKTVSLLICYFMFFLIRAFVLFVCLRFWLVCHFTFISFVLQTIKFATLLLVHFYSNNSELKRMPLSIQSNINKDLSDDDVDSGDEILYNFRDATSQLMTDDGITPWRGPWEKYSLLFQILIGVLSKSKDIVVDLIASTNINPFGFILIYFFNIISISTNILSLIVLFVIVYYLFDRSLHTCLPYFEVSPPSIGRYNNVFDSILKSLII
jgi:hypothetical protein